MGDLSFLVDSSPPPAKVQHKVYSPRGGNLSGTASKNPYDESWGKRKELHQQVCRTQQLYARLTSQTPMTRTLLSRVPITFIRNLFVDVSSSTGFGANAFDKQELASIGRPNKDGRSEKDISQAFIEKLKVIVAEALDEQPMDTTALMTDPLARNEFLHKLHDAASLYTQARSALKTNWHCIPDLENVIAEAEKRGVPTEEQTKAQVALDQKKSFLLRAQAGLNDAVHGRDIDTLERTIMAAENHAVPAHEVQEARVVLANMKAHKALNAATGGNSVIELEKAVAAAERSTLPKDEIAKAKVVLGQMKARSNLNIAIGQTLYGTTVSDLERAIAEAVKNNLPQPEIDKAKKVLSQKLEALSTGSRKR